MSKNSIKNMVDGTVKAKYLERLEGFLEQIEDKMGELQHVISLNEAILKLVESSDQADEPLCKEAIESFTIVIKMSKDQNATSSLKRDAAMRLVELIKSGKEVSPVTFMTDFDKIAGQ